jgi:hypothetical protein
MLVAPSIFKTHSISGREYDLKPCFLIKKYEINVSFQLEQKKKKEPLFSSL